MSENDKEKARPPDSQTVPDTTQQSTFTASDLEEARTYAARMGYVRDEGDPGVDFFREWKKSGGTVEFRRK